MTNPPILPDATAQGLGSMLPQQPQRQSTALTPYGQYVWRQVQRMKIRGASAADIGDFIKHVEAHPGIRVAIEEPVDDPNDPGMVRGLSQQLLQGVTFGWGDEAIGTLYGMFSGEGTAQEGRDLYRAELASFRSKHPGLSVGANIAGAVGTLPLLPANLLAGGGALGGAAVGAGMAGLAGAGEATGDLSERAKAALWNAPFGAAVGAAGPPILRLLGSTAGRLGTGAANLVAKVAPEFTAGVKSLMQSLPGMPGRVARHLLADALAKDGITPEAAATLVEQRAAHGLPTTVADVGGAHTLATGITAQGFQTPEQQLLVTRLLARESAKGARLLGAIGTGSRLGLRNAYELGEQLMAQRAARAAPLYQDAFQQTVKLTPGLRDLLSKPVYQQAYEVGRATSLAEDAAGMNRGLAIPELPTDGTTVTELPVRALDYMKRGLQHIIETAGREGRPPLSRQTASALNARLGQALTEIDAQVPTYAQARGVFHSYSQKLEALEAGRENFFRLSPEDITRELRASAAPEMYRIGQLQALADAVHGVSGSETADVARRFMGASIYGNAERTMLRKIQTMFDNPSAAQDFVDRLAGEAASTRAMQRYSTAGSALRPKAATQALNPPSMVRRFSERVGVTTPAARQGRARDIANEVTMLFTKGLDDPHELAAMLRSLPAFLRASQVGTVALRGTGRIIPAQIQQR